MVLLMNKIFIKSDSYRKKNFCLWTNTENIELKSYNTVIILIQNFNNYNV